MTGASLTDRTSGWDEWDEWDEANDASQFDWPSWDEYRHRPQTTGPIGDHLVPNGTVNQVNLAEPVPPSSQDGTSDEPGSDEDGESEEDTSYDFDQEVQAEPVPQTRQDAEADWQRAAARPSRCTKLPRSPLCVQAAPTGTSQHAGVSCEGGSPNASAMYDNVLRLDHYLRPSNGRTQTKDVDPGPIPPVMPDLHAAELPLDEGPDFDFNDWLLFDGNDSRSTSSETTTESPDPTADPFADPIQPDAQSNENITLPPASSTTSDGFVSKALAFLDHFMRQQNANTPEPVGEQAQLDPSAQASLDPGPPSSNSSRASDGTGAGKDSSTPCTSKCQKMRKPRRERQMRRETLVENLYRTFRSHRRETDRLFINGGDPVTPMSPKMMSELRILDPDFYEMRVIVESRASSPIMGLGFAFDFNDNFSLSLSNTTSGFFSDKTSDFAIPEDQDIADPQWSPCPPRRRATSMINELDPFSDAYTGRTSVSMERAPSPNPVSVQQGHGLSSDPVSNSRDDASDLFGAASASPGDSLPAGAALNGENQRERSPSESPPPITPELDFEELVQILTRPEYRKPDKGKGRAVPTPPPPSPTQAPSTPKVRSPTSPPRALAEAIMMALQSGNGHELDVDMDEDDDSTEAILEIEAMQLQWAVAESLQDLKMSPESNVMYEGESVAGPSRARPDDGESPSNTSPGRLDAGERLIVFGRTRARAGDVSMSSSSSDDAMDEQDHSAGRADGDDDHMASDSGEEEDAPMYGSWMAGTPGVRRRDAYDREVDDDDDEGPSMYRTWNAHRYTTPQSPQTPSPPTRTPLPTPTPSPTIPRPRFGRMGSITEVPCRDQGTDDSPDFDDIQAVAHQLLRLSTTPPSPTFSPARPVLRHSPTYTLPPPPPPRRRSSVMPLGSPRTPVVARLILPAARPGLITPARPAVTLTVPSPESSPPLCPTPDPSTIDESLLSPPVIPRPNRRTAPSQAVTPRAMPPQAAPPQAALLQASYLQSTPPQTAPPRVVPPPSPKRPRSPDSSKNENGRSALDSRPPKSPRLASSSPHDGPSRSRKGAKKACRGLSKHANTPHNRERL